MSADLAHYFDEEWPAHYDAAMGLFLGVCQRSGSPNLAGNMHRDGPAVARNQKIAQPRKPEGHSRWTGAWVERERFREPGWWARVELPDFTRPEAN